MPQLTLDDDLLYAAQAYARQHGQELDALLTGLLQAAVRPAEAPPAVPTRPLSPRIQRLLGAVRLPDNFDYKKTLEEALQERFLP